MVCSTWNPCRVSSAAPAELANLQHLTFLQSKGQLLRKETCKGWFVDWTAHPDVVSCTTCTIPASHITCHQVYAAPSHVHHDTHACALHLEHSLALSRESHQAGFVCGILHAERLLHCSCLSCLSASPHAVWSMQDWSCLSCQQNLLRAPSRRLAMSDAATQLRRCMPAVHLLLLHPATPLQQAPAHQQHPN